MLVIWQVDGAGELFSFDGVFNGETSQAEVFEKVGRPVVEGCLDGVHGTILAYGQNLCSKLRRQPLIRNQHTYIYIYIYIYMYICFCAPDGLLTDSLGTIDAMPRACHGMLWHMPWHAIACCGT